MKTLPTVLTLDQIRILGFEALCERLGPAAALRFVRQYELGSGDYTRERHSLLKELTLDRVLELSAAQPRRRAPCRPKRRGMR